MSDVSARQRQAYEALLRHDDGPFISARPASEGIVYRLGAEEFRYTATSPRCAAPSGDAAG